MNILIIGGRGYFGNEISGILVKDPEYKVWIGSREASSGNVVNITWEDPAFTEKIKPFDVVINTTSWNEDASYFRNIQNMVISGKIIIETTADPVLISKIQDMEEKWTQYVSDKPKGIFIHGMGIFPGLSNLFCKYYVQKCTNVTHIKFAIQYTIFSGAGKGMCQLMAKTILEPSRWIEDGKEKRGSPIGTAVSFTSNKQHLTGFRVVLPDLLYLKKRWPVPMIETLLSIRPRWLNVIAPMFNILPNAKWISMILAHYFYFIRGSICKKRRTELEMSIGINEQTYHTLYVSDAFLAGSVCIQACLKSITLNGLGDKSGFQTIESCFDFEQIINIMQSNGPGNLVINWA